MNINKIKNWCKQNQSSLLLIICSLFGLLVGFIAKTIIQISPLALKYIELPGKLVIHAFMMILVPLVVTSISLGIASTKRGENKRLIILTFSLFIIFSSYASLFGITMMLITKPGARNEQIIDNLTEPNYNNNINVNQIASQEDSIYDIFINIIPDNIITATFMQHYTAIVPVNANNLTLGYQKVNEKSYRTNMLGLCVFSLVLGFAVMSLDSKAEYIKKLLEETNSIVTFIITAIIKVMPIGMFCLMFAEAVKMQSPDTVLAQLGWFFATVFLTFSVHLFLVWPAIYFIIVRQNPYKFYANIIPAILIALSSASSGVTLPMTIKCMEENNKLDQTVSKFVLPLGMTIHMNGCAMFYPMIVVFVAQMQGVSINIQLLFTLWLFTVLISMALPGVYGGGSSIVTFVALCASIGINNPLEVLAYTMPFDWLIERIRTATNIIGDCFVAIIIQKLY